MSAQLLFSKFVLMAVATHMRHAAAACRQLAVTGPAGKPERDGTSSRQILQVLRSSLVGMVIALEATMGGSGASVDPVRLGGFALETLVQIMTCQYAKPNHPA